MSLAHTAVIAEPVAALAAGQEQRWHAWQARNAARERVNRERLADACLFAVTATALMSAFWISFGAR